MPSDAEVVLATALARPPTLHEGRLVCIDGPAGSGKTTLAAGIAAATGAAVVHTDELLHGWRGLPGLAASLDAMLRPLAGGLPGSWRRWDWYADDWAEDHPVAPAPLLVVEGVGSGAAPIADLITTLVWVEAPPELRLARGMARDGEQMAPHWAQWMIDEDELHAADGTRDRADVVLDGTGVRPPAVR
ncbi:4-amino-4-deoxy-L-arabinose transferase [Nocardioides sp. InS609-2]|uniref:4-amino-4-deoxy-L-arabinose transferase n=1 Tax=Nocardioides sp. InS609-2 TaxID=2760705 RepID=UPI0020BFD8F8|nr:4-amino-4-deoxy-L-arabinose transferase [Nocardioides sp. InS609-2]